MVNLRRFVAVALIAICAVGAFAQSDSTEMSVEDSYLQQSVENAIIREQSRADTREMKQFAIKLIDDAISNGNTSDEVENSLEYLGLEGTINRGRENGRLINNYPDVRRDAARLLGKMGTVKAKDALLQMIYYDNEPMVLQEAVKSLADIGNNDDGKTVSTIAWILQKFDNTNPDNLLALSAIEAFEKLGAVSGGLKDPLAIQMLMRIADGDYLRPVRKRAEDAMVNIRKASAQSKKQQQADAQKQ